MITYQGPPGGKLTITRAGDTATYWGADKLLKTALANTLRRDFDPRLGGRGLYLREPARTNVVLWNRDLSNAAWTKTNITAAKNQIGVDGVANSASSLTATSSNGTCLQAITLASSARFHWCFLKRVTGYGVIEMTMDNGSTWVPVIVTQAWEAIEIPTQTLANPTVGFRIATSGDAIAVDYVTNENGTFRTSPVATTSAAVTRPADIITLAATEFPYSLTAQSFAIEFVPMDLSAISGVFSLHNGTGNRFNMRTRTDPEFQVTISSGGSESVDKTSGWASIPTVMELNWFAFRVAPNDFAGSAHGKAPGTDATVTMPASIVTLRIGDLEGGVAPGALWLSKFLAVPVALDNDQLRSALRTKADLYDFYIDSSNGDSGNDGLTAGSAFEAVADLPALSEGARIRLVGRSHLREQLDIPHGAVVEGDGEALLDASDLLVVGDISKTGGRTNVYQFTKTLPAFGSGNAYLGMWENDIRYVRVASEALCDSTAGSLFPSTDSGGSTVFKFHAFGSANPTSDGKRREYTARFYGLNGRDSDSVAVRGLKTRRNASIGGSLWTGRHARIVDMVCYDGNNHCLQYKDGSYLENVVARNVYYLLNTPTHFVFFENTPAELGIRHVRCRAEQDGAAVDAYAYFGHNGVSGSFGTITYDECEAHNILRGYSHGSGAGQLVVTDQVYKAASGGTPFFCNSASDMVGYGGTFSGIANLVRFTAFASDSVVEIHDTTASCSADPVAGSGDADNVVMSIFDCVLSEGGSGTAGVTLFGDAPTLRMHGTRISTNNVHRYIYTDGVTDLHSDRNEFVGNKGFRIGGVNYADLAAYQAATGQDANSVLV